MQKRAISCGSLTKRESAKIEIMEPTISQTPPSFGQNADVTTAGSVDNGPQTIAIHALAGSSFPNTKIAFSAV